MRARASSQRTSAATRAEVRPTRSDAEVGAALDLRERVFAVEQGVDPAADRDGRDHEALHLVAVEGEHVIGTCRLVFNGSQARLGRLAVLRSRRREGLGGLLLAEADRQARAAGARRIDLHAQLPARELYLRGGYSQSGAVFVEEGIEHVAMDKRLA
jgi:predicted GNAT family N-acyltransferase